MLPHEVVQEGHEPVMVQLLLVSFASHGLLVRFHRQRLLCNMYHLCTRLPIFPVYDMYISARAHAPTRRNRPLTKSVRRSRPIEVRLSPPSALKTALVYNLYTDSIPCTAP